MFVDVCCVCVVILYVASVTWVLFSVADLAVMSLRSPRKLVIITIKKCIYRIKVSNKVNN